MKQSQDLLRMGASLLLVALLTTVCVGITMYLQPRLRSDLVPSMMITF